MDTSKAITKALAQKEMSQSELARRIKCTPSAVSQLCNKNRKASTRKLEQIAKELGLTYIELVTLGQ